MKPFVISLGALALVVSLAAGAGAARPEPIRLPEPKSAQRAKPAPARLSPAELPAGRDGSAILTTPAPGRYSIRVKSPSGARIELVDMIEGPTDSAGAPGLRDGRIDALLDKGAYKIRVANAKGASGKALLSAEPFVEVDGETPALVAGTDPKRRTRRFAATDLYARCRAGGPRRDRGRGARPRRPAALAPGRRIGRSRLRAGAMSNPSPASS